MKQKQIQLEANQKLASIRQKRDAEILNLKASAKATAKAQSVKAVKVGHIELTEEAKNSFSLIVMRKDKGEFKEGDIISRPSMGKFLTPELESKLNAIKSTAKKEIEAIREARDKKLAEANKEKAEERKKKAEAKIKAMEEKIAKIKQSF